MCEHIDDLSDVLTYDRHKTAEITLATYYVEAPSDPEATGEYSFGPFEVRPREGSGGWVAASDTSSRERVVGAEQP
jgi:hypothetical protein